MRRNSQGICLMSGKQREHEGYWGRCWAVALEYHLAAEVHPSRPSDDPPDIDFHIEHPDGTVLTSWGEITGTYYDATEANGCGAQTPRVLMVCILNPTRSSGHARALWSNASATSTTISSSAAAGTLTGPLAQPFDDPQYAGRAEKSSLR